MSRETASQLQSTRTGAESLPINYTVLLGRVVETNVCLQTPGYLPYRASILDGCACGEFNSKRHNRSVRVSCNNQSLRSCLTNVIVSSRGVGRNHGHRTEWCSKQRAAVDHVPPPTSFTGEILMTLPPTNPTQQTYGCEPNKSLHVGPHLRWICDRIMAPLNIKCRGKKSQCQKNTHSLAVCDRDRLEEESSSSRRRELVLRLTRP